LVYGHVCNCLFFRSTKDPGQKPFTFDVGLGRVIKGWDEGCLTMSEGEVAQLTIAGYKGYGAQGFPAWGYPFCAFSLIVCPQL
jgi:FKBP-type peptidyl-prolyl cis-trans isomerase